MLKSKRAMSDSMREELARLSENVESIPTSEERIVEIHQRIQSLNDQLQVKQKKKEDIQREVELLKMNAVTLEAQLRERKQPRNKQKCRTAPNAVNASGTYTLPVYRYICVCILIFSLFSCVKNISY